MLAVLTRDESGTSLAPVPGNFYVLKYTQMAALLLENGFMDSQVVCILISCPHISFNAIDCCDLTAEGIAAVYP